MLSPPALIKRDLLEAAKRNRARQYEEQRKSRIFNARKRLIGIDEEALKKQIAEKQAIKDEEMAREKAYYKQMMNDIQIADELDRQIQNNRKILMEEMLEYRKNYQKKENSREFDLNDKDFKLKMIPDRINDEDPRLTLSSMQKFEGEESDDRKKQQVEQQKAWLLQQITEKKRNEEDKKLAESIYMESMQARGQRLEQLTSLEQQCRKQLEIATVEFNKALAREQANAKRQQQLRELEDNNAEIYNAITGDFLTENLLVAESNLGISKKRACNYKGMSQAELDQIREEQRKQIKENQFNKQQEKKVEQTWDDLAHAFGNKVFLEDRRRMREQRENLKLLNDENCFLLEEQKIHRKYLESLILPNIPTASFYDQFNTGTR